MERGGAVLPPVIFPSPDPAATKSHKWVTLNNFLKRDAYSGLRAAMLAQDYQQVCYLAIELACTPKEQRPLVLFVLDVYCQSFLSRNATVLHAVLDRSEELLVSAKSCKCINDDAFRKTLCQLLLLVAQEPVKDTAAVLESGDPAAAGADSRGGTRATAPIDVDGSPAFRYRAFLTTPVCAGIAQLLHAVALANVHQALVCARFLASVPPHEVQPAEFEIVHALSDAQRKDIVWYAWDALLTWAEDSVASSSVANYIRAAAMLYTLGWTKKLRAVRLNLLYMSVVVACTRRVRRDDDRLKTALLASATQNIGVVFDETLGMPPRRTDYLRYYSRTPPT